VVNEANANPDVKCILVYGGKDFFSSGLDLGIFMDAIKGKYDLDEIIERTTVKNLPHLFGCIINSPKPVVFLKRGMSVGFSFTMACCADFCYSTPDATFMTPFMKSF